MAGLYSAQLSKSIKNFLQSGLKKYFPRSQINLIAGGQLAGF